MIRITARANYQNRQLSNRTTNLVSADTQENGFVIHIFIKGGFISRIIMVNVIECPTN